MAERVSPQGTAPFNLPTLQSLGVNAAYIDVAKQMGYSENEIRSAMSEGEKALKRITNQLRIETDAKERERLTTLREQYRQRYVDIRLDYRAVRKWREERGIPSRARQAQLTEIGRAELTEAEKANELKSIEEAIK
jgi:hypothetical protein